MEEKQQPLAAQGRHGNGNGERRHCGFNNVHPIWKTVHVAVVMGIVTFFLWATADSFDGTEYVAMMGILSALIIYAFGENGARVFLDRLGVKTKKERD